MRKAEARAQAERQRARATAEQTEAALDGPSQEAFDRVRDDIFGQFLAAGQSRDVARRNAERFAREHVRPRKGPQTVLDPPSVKSPR